MLKTKISAAPPKPGVYIFRNAQRRVLYIGKAANLKTRLASYFHKSAPLSPATRSMLKKSASCEWRRADSNVEALIVEARLIKQHRPTYNVLLRDDKNYFFVGFSRDGLPRIFLTHQPIAPRTDADKNADPRGRQREATRPTTQTHAGGPRKSASSLRESATYVGPFTDGVAIKRTLRLLRRVFPYATHKGFPKRCLEYDMGLCPIPPSPRRSPAERDEGGPADHKSFPPEFLRAYRRNIRAIRDVLVGKRTTLVKRLEKEMRAAARREDFAAAAQRRDEIRGLERVFRHRTVVNTRTEHSMTRAEIPPQIRRLLPDYTGRTGIVRIEGYDIANLKGGKAATGAMVVFQNGSPDPSSYRHFRIKTVRGANDVAMVAEVLQRRLRHVEWPLPDVILVDGGKPQLNAAIATVKAIEAVGAVKAVVKRITVIALAKRNEELYLPDRTTSLRLPKSDPFLKLLMHVRDEAHRFARRYHHRLRDLDGSS